jgi:hypothetical protein
LKKIALFTLLFLGSRAQAMDYSTLAQASDMVRKAQRLVNVDHPNANGLSTLQNLLALPEIHTSQEWGQIHQLVNTLLALKANPDLINPETKLTVIADFFMLHKAETDPTNCVHVCAIMKTLAKKACLHRVDEAGETTLQALIKQAWEKRTLSEKLYHRLRNGFSELLEEEEEEEVKADEEESTN